MAIKTDISKALKSIAEVELKMKAAIGLYADTSAKKLESHAKNNASWTDRTALARKTISGGYEWKGNKCLIFVSGNTDYFEYLEFTNEKKYAILYPTINQLSPSIIRGMNNLLRK